MLPVAQAYYGENNEYGGKHGCKPEGLIGVFTDVDAIDGDP